MAGSSSDKRRPSRPWLERRSNAGGPIPEGGDRRRPLSDLSAEEFVRLARLRAGLDPELPAEAEVGSEAGGSGWTTGATAPTVAAGDGLSDTSGEGDFGGRHPDERVSGESVSAERESGEGLSGGPDAHHWESVQGESGDGDSGPGSSDGSDSDGSDSDYGDSGSSDMGERDSGDGDLGERDQRDGGSGAAATEDVVAGPQPGNGSAGSRDSESHDGREDMLKEHGPDRERGHWPVGEPRTGELEAGAGRVAAGLALLEAPADLDDGCLQARTADLVRLHSLVTSAVTAHVRAWDARCLWATDRSKSPSARLARDANCAPASCRSWVWLGRALARMPVTAEALDQGRISTDHARRLAQACTDERLELFLAAEEELVADAVNLAGRFSSFERVMAVWEQAADDRLHDPTDPTDLPKGEKKQKADRHCTLRNTENGFGLAASFTRVGGEIVRNELQRRYDELWRQDWDEARARLGDSALICDADLGRTNRQRWSDAMVEMARRSGACRPGDQMPKPLITVHVTAADMTGPIRETFNGLVMTRRDVADLIADGAEWERIIYGPGGQPVNLTSTQRNFTGLLRRAVQLRDRVCSHPMCDVEAERCQVDHIVEHADGGPTNIENARLLCPKHNLQRPGRGKKPPPSDGADDPDDKSGL